MMNFSHFHAFNECKEQILANLANFSYDPVNYAWLRQLGVLDLFLDHLSSTSTTLKKFAIAGLCNISLDPSNKSYILSQDGVTHVIGCLSSEDESTVLSAITTLMYLVTPQSKQDITKPAVIDCMLKFSTSSNVRLKNLALIFLQDYCSPEQVESVSGVSSVSSDR
ncbi:armadillo repeat-containing protein 7-like isoform X2 [Oratosquilla oratoria]|uniref:armadillo repeat-containing protein 7-like isoform X2 n=1 Tax=Oratosquilla oratoria TaxID=337810 RepID=UPI003F76513A